MKTGTWFTACNHIQWRGVEQPIISLGDSSDFLAVMWETHQKRGNLMAFAHHQEQLPMTSVAIAGDFRSNSR